ncbi:hypothetical protein [Phycicoccus sp. Soil803]|uniref:hypothetical protein n=1 Tax=Phycicoccus sp. Soil803 TaxID=1736415 RepID=UPI000A5D61C3|nr:hypothetical protein [Phycicoccus sp. Soil803]
MTIVEWSLRTFDHACRKSSDIRENAAATVTETRAATRAGTHTEVHHELDVSMAREVKATINKESHALGGRPAVSRR